MINNRRLGPNFVGSQSNRAGRFRGLRLEALENRLLLAAVTWDGGGDGTSWFDPANWDVNGVDQLPTSIDDVTINLPGSDPTIEFGGADQIVNSLVSSENVNINSNSLTIHGQGQFNSALNIAEATLTADGPLAFITAVSVGSIHLSSLKSFNGGTISLPATSYAGTGFNSTRFLASGLGSTIDLPQLTTLSGGGFVATFFINADNGGVINLSGLTEITGNATQIVAEDLGSQIDLSSLTSFVDTNGNRTSLIEERNGGEILAASLTSLSAVTINLNANSTLSTSQITSVTDGAINVYALTADLSNLTNLTNTSVDLSGSGTANLNSAMFINGASFVVNDGVTLTLPDATSYAGQSNGVTRFRAAGANSVLNFPNLGTLSGGSFISTFFVEASNGGLVNLSALTDITGGATQVFSDGTGSQIDLTLLSTFIDTNDNRASIIDENNAGVIVAPNLTSVSAVTLNLDGDSTISTVQLESFVGGAINVVNVAADLVGLTDVTNTQIKLTMGATANIDNVTQINGASFIVEGGVTLTVPQPTTYVGDSRATTSFRATGPGSRLEFPALTQMSGASFIGRHRVEAIGGGTVDLGSVTTVPGELTVFVADGMDSLIDLSQTNSINLSGSRQATMTAINGGLVELKNGLVDINRLTITLSPTGTVQAGTLQLGQLAQVQGAGALNSSVINSGQFFPGNSPRQQVVNGSFTQTALGRIHVELGGLTPITEYDQLVVNGPASLDGTLNVTLVNGFNPGERDQFDLITYASMDGAISTVNGTILTSGLVLDPQVSTTTFSLRALPELTLASTEVVEGNTGIVQAVFQISLSTSVGYDLSVDFQTVDDFARSSSDYTFVADTLMIPAGADTATIIVDVWGDQGLERDEAFFVVLNNPVDVALGNVQAVGTILNDDVIPSIEITDVTAFEPAIGMKQFEFEVHLSAPAPDPVQVDFATMDGTALAGVDYLATSGTLSFVASASRGLVSDGSDGPFHPTSNTTLALPPDGIFNFTSVNIPAGVTVQFTQNALNTPVIMLAQTDVLIAGTIFVSANGMLGGPGGGAGGVKGVGIMDGTDGTGLSPGTGGGAMTGFVGSGGGGGGLGTAGLDPTNWVGPLPGAGGAAVPFPEEIYDRGGSGGGGGGGWFKFAPLSGGNGGGGGGGVVVSSSHGAIIVDGAIRANGSNGGTAFANAFGWGGPGGGGSGGVIDLEADTIIVNGTLEAVGGNGGGIGTVPSNSPDFSSQANGGDGYIRLTTTQFLSQGSILGQMISREFDTRQVIRVGVLADPPGEPDETFLLQLTNAINALFRDDLGVGTILDSTANPGDFDSDGMFDADDIDALVAAIASGTHSSEFDLTSDGNVDLADRDAWLVLAGAANLPSGNAYLIGDANLDGTVDGVDFIAWNLHKFTNVAAWTAADFNADGTVDGQDFIAWNINKFTSADSQQSAKPVDEQDVISDHRMPHFFELGAGEKTSRLDQLRRRQIIEFWNTFDESDGKSLD